MMKINMQFIALALALLFLNVNGASAQDRSYEGGFYSSADFVYYHPRSSENIY